MKFNYLNSNGEQSSKRLFTFLLVLLFITYAIANMFFGKVLKDSIEENLFYLTTIFYTGVAGEKLMSSISGKKTKTEKTEE